MALWSAETLQRVRAIIAKHHAAISLSIFGAQSLPPDLVKDLRASGIQLPDTPDLISDPFTYGQLLAILRDPNLASKTVQQVAQLVEDRKQELALSAQEKAAIDTAKKHAGQYVVGLGTRVAGQVLGAITGAEANLTPERMIEIIRDKTAANLEKRQTIQQLKSDLGHAMGNWTRDWDRIALTETNNAIQEGLASTIEKRHGTEARVSKIPAPSACPECVAAYLDADGNPKVFKLSELRANGTNFGRKDKRAVVEGVHPRCACVLQFLPPGTQWVGGELVPGRPDEEETEQEEKSERPWREPPKLILRKAEAIDDAPLDTGLLAPIPWTPYTGPRQPARKPT